jgi:hypothetical protein
MEFSFAKRRARRAFEPGLRYARRRSRSVDSARFPHGGHREPVRRSGYPDHDPVDDSERGIVFYRDVLGIPLLFAEPRRQLLKSEVAFAGA